MELIRISGREFTHAISIEIVKNSTLNVHTLRYEIQLSMKYFIVFTPASNKPPKIGVRAGINIMVISLLVIQLFIIVLFDIMFLSLAN